MTDAFEDHEGTVSIGGRTITNLRFADDIDGLAGKEEELANLVERLDKALVSGSFTWEYEGKGYDGSQDSWLVRGPDS